MIKKCSLSDIDRINELGILISDNFSKVNNIEDIILNEEIIGYYDNDKLVGFLIFKKLYNYLFNLDFDKIMLEVSVDNKNAIKLYKKFNFKIINIRKNYYDNIDAYVMEAKK